MKGNFRFPVVDAEMHRNLSNCVISILTKNILQHSDVLYDRKAREGQSVNIME